MSLVDLFAVFQSFIDLTVKALFLEFQNLRSPIVKLSLCENDCSSKKKIMKIVVIETLVFFRYLKAIEFHIYIILKLVRK